jgi:hypothetical protein
VLVALLLDAWLAVEVEEDPPPTDDPWKGAF